MSSSASLILTTLMMIFGLLGCAALPAAGPGLVDLSAQATAESADFAVIPLTGRNIAVVGPAMVRSINDGLGTTASRPARPMIDVGDQLVVSIWEPSSDGLFSTAENKQTQIDVAVDESKSIFIPYAGRVSVAGFGVEDLRDEIANKLQGQAIEPQVQVTLVARESQKLTVVGDVNAPGQFDVPPNGLRLIEAIALASGASAPSFESEVTVVRGTTRATVRMDNILQGNTNNIWLRPRDTIQVKHRPRSFTAFGAVTSQNLQPFQTERVTLAEALAQSGGLNDNLADAGGVFLFRYENPKRLDEIAVQQSVQATSQGIPTIYQLDFSQPEAFFLASAFIMRDKDIIYVANAPATDLQKFAATILAPIVGTAQAAEVLGN